MSRPNTENVLFILASSEGGLTKEEILTTLGTYEMAKTATEELTGQETYEYYTNLDGLFYSAIKRIRTKLAKEGTGIKLTSIDRKFELTSDSDQIQAYLNTPQRIGRTGSYLETIQGIQTGNAQDLENGEVAVNRITEANKRFASYAKAAQAAQTKDEVVTEA